MRYHIQHTTTYTYDRPAFLSPHILRLRPRCDVTQRLHQFSLTFHPDPVHIADNVDLDGNAITQVQFANDGVTELTISATSDVETFRINPFDYVLETWATHLPIDYPASLLHSLQPYLRGQFSPTGAIDPVATQLAQEIWQATEGAVIPFLSDLNQRIYATCTYSLRETGNPLPPAITWLQRNGSCRDYAVLFVEVCRAAGLAARFVSGYQEGDADSDDRHLHAWAEVYLPGAGWHGYDPTHGLAVADRHIALVATPIATQSVPVSGTLKQAGVKSEMRYQLTIRLA